MGSIALATNAGADDFVERLQVSGEKPWHSDTIGIPGYLNNAISDLLRINYDAHRNARR